MGRIVDAGQFTDNELSKHASVRVRRKGKCWLILGMGAKFCRFIAKAVLGACQSNVTSGGSDAETA